MGRKAANLAGLAALAGVAYANRDKLFGKKDKDSGKVSGTPDLSVTKDDNYSNEGRTPPRSSGSSSSSTTRATPAPTPTPVDTSDRNEDYGNEGRRSAMGSSASPIYMSKTPGGDAKRTEGNKPMPSLKAVEARAAANRTDAMRNASRANVAAANKMKRMAANPEAQALEASNPEMVLTPGGGLKTAANMAKNLANRGGKEVAEYSTPLLNAPAKQLTGPSKAELMARDRAARASTRQEEMLRENARRSGLDPDNINPAVANKVRENMGGPDFSLGMKRGGAVKMTASRRGDGIASRGKTRGKLY